MASITIEELSRSMNWNLMVTNLLNLSCSNATGLILAKRDGLVKIREESVYQGKDVYIVAQ
jgi:hypothetical protein